MFKQAMEIQKLKNTLSEKEAHISILKDENEKLKKMVRGERVCGAHCDKCENGYLKNGWGDRGCLLDITCKDFSRKA